MNTTSKQITRNTVTTTIETLANLLLRTSRTLRKEKEMLEINRFKTSRTTMWLLISAVSLMLAAALPTSSLAQDSNQDHSGHASGQEMKVPQTAQEHRERAEQYQKKAAEYRREAEAH